MKNLKEFEDKHDPIGYELTADRWWKRDEYYNSGFTGKMEFRWQDFWDHETDDNGGIKSPRDMVEYLVNSELVREITLAAYCHSDDAFLDNEKTVRTWTVSKNAGRKELDSIINEIWLFISEAFETGTENSE